MFRVNRASARIGIPVTLAAALLVGGSLRVGRATGPYFFTSEGCDGYGFSTWAGTNQSHSETSAEVIGTSTGCNWTYVAGNFQDTDGVWHYGIGPHWQQDDYTYAAYSDVQAANYVGHTACNPGGPCSGAVYTWTSLN